MRDATLVMDRIFPSRGCPARRTGTVADFAALVAALSPELTAVLPKLMS